MNTNELNRALIETIKSPELESLVTDFSEIAVDQLSDIDGVLKDVPIFGSIIKVIKLGFSIKDIVFLKKLSRFLWHLRDVPHGKRAELTQKLEQDSNFE